MQPKGFLVLLFSILTTLLVSFSACSDVTSDKNNEASEPEEDVGASNDESISYYHIIDLLSLDNPEMLEILQDGDLRYNESESSRFWLTLGDEIANKYDSTSITLISSGSDWGGSNEVPESEMVLNSFNIDRARITLLTPNPSKSLYNSQETAALIADSIEESCGFEGRDRDDEYNSESKLFVRHGYVKRGGDTYFWDITLEDASDRSTATIEVNHLIWDE